MARTVFLHIGIEKTGTTTLQAVGRVNRETLAKRGILYPETPGEANHTKLALYATEGNLIGDIRRSAGLAGDADFEAFRERFPTALRDEIERSGCDRIWLSNEHLSSRIRRPTEIARLAELLQPLADEISVVVYLRDQPELFLSAYSTAIRSGNDRDMVPPRTGKEYYYNFEIMLSRWARAFGKAALTVRIFDRSRLQGGDIVADFFQVLGTELDAEIRVPSGLNRSLDAHALQFLRMFSRHVPWLLENGVNPEHADIGSVLEGISVGPKLAAPGRVMRMIAETFAESNAQVARRFLGRPDGVLFKARDYPEAGTLQPLSPSTARAIGMLVCEAKDTQVVQTERRAASLGVPAPERTDYPDETGLLAARSEDEIVAAAADIWRRRQRRLLHLRDMLRPKRDLDRSAA